MTLTSAKQAWIKAQSYFDAGDTTHGLSELDKALTRFSELSRPNTHDSQLTQSFSAIVDTCLSLFPNEVVFALPAYCSQSEDFTRRPKPLSWQVLKSRWKDFFLEQEWKIQCLRKYGGPKPEGMSWRQFYLQCESELKSAKDKGKDIDWAVTQGHIKWIHYALKERPHHSQHYPIHFAILKRYISIVRYVLSQGLDPNTKINSHWSLLHVAVFSGSSKMVNILLNFGADINSQDQQGLSPLMWAIKLKEMKIAILLIGKGADPFIQDKAQQNALMLSIYYRENRLLSRLLESGEWAAPQTLFNFTWLHLTVIAGLIPSSQHFIKQGGLVGCTDWFGRTPLHWAALLGYLDIVKLLIEHGAKVHNEDRFYMTPLMLATLSGYPKVVQYLATKLPQGPLE